MEFIGQLRRLRYGDADARTDAFWMALNRPLPESEVGFVCEFVLFVCEFVIFVCEFVLCVCMCVCMCVCVCVF